MDLSTNGAFPSSASANMGRIVINRTLGPSVGLAHRQLVHPLQNYMVSRLKVRARFQLSTEGCTFSLKFAENARTDEQYCLLTHGATMQVWEMSGVYTRRKEGQLNGAHLVLSAREHADVVSACVWMPSHFSEPVDLAPSSSTSNASRSLQSDAASLRRRSVVTSREILPASSTTPSNPRIPSPAPSTRPTELNPPRQHHSNGNAEANPSSSMARDHYARMREDNDVISSSNDSVSAESDHSQDDEEEHEEEVNPLHFSIPPFFTAGFDKEIRFHRHGTCVATLTEHNDWVRFMSVNQDGSRLISGSVNSNIFGWDTTTLKPIWKIAPAHEAPTHLQHSLQGINSINGLEWMRSMPVFASGAGDGSIKIWDVRTLSRQSSTSSSVATILAHDGKLNNLLWLQDERFMLSSGRDDVIRLLDLRMLGDLASSTHTLSSASASSSSSSLSSSSSSSFSSALSASGPTAREKLVVREYSGHSCSGYNIQASLWENDRFVASGSRDGKIFIFETASGKLVNTLIGPVQPTHLVVPLPEKCGPGLISATAVSAHIFVWAPSSTTENSPESNLVPPDVEDDDSLVEMARQEALESTISQFGERFLRALRQDGPGSRVFFDAQVRAVYNYHMFHALQRRGRTHLAFPANYQPPEMPQGTQPPPPPQQPQQDGRGPNAMDEG